MKFKRMIACVLSAALMLPVFVQAAEEKLAEINDSGVITVSGTTEEIAGTKVTFMITRPGYDDTSLENEITANEAVEELYQGEVGEDGTFTYTYTLSPRSKSGNYTVSVKIYGETSKRTDTVYFKNTQNLKYAADAINNNTMSTADVINTFKDDIDYDTGVKWDNATEDQRAYIAGAIKAPVTETELTEQFKEYTEIALTLLGNDSITKNEIKTAIEDQNEKIGLTDDEYATYTALSESEKEVAIAYMADNYSGTESMSEFIALFKEAVKEAEDDDDKGSGKAPSHSGGGSSSSKGASGMIAAPGAENVYLLDPADTESFTDLGDASWAKDAVEKLAELEIVNGKGEKIFAPNANITREEFVSIIVRAFQLAKADKEPLFADVDASAWYYDSVKIAYSCGIITGYDENTFGIGEPITRQDMAVIIKRAVDFSNMELYPIYIDKTLNDAELISDYAKDAVDTMIKAGVINGYEDGSFGPHNQATRAQAAQIIYNILFK